MVVDDLDSGHLLGQRAQRLVLTLVENGAAKIDHAVALTSILVTGAQFCVSNGGHHLFDLLRMSLDKALAARPGPNKNSSHRDGAEYCPVQQGPASPRLLPSVHQLRASRIVRRTRSGESGFLNHTPGRLAAHSASPPALAVSTMIGVPPRAGLERSQPTASAPRTSRN